MEKMIAINTTNPPGNELAVAKFVKPLLDEAGFETRLFETAPGAGKFVGTLEGNRKEKDPFDYDAYRCGGRS